ncbi:hypothetical protein [Nostoc sp. UHCC 0302]|uniref:hypothetical protein n=1 Tax=Nostoc sp. UHCC 0302 TaxID=3134896 RepID=UPI00311CAC0E
MDSASEARSPLALAQRSRLCNICNSTLTFSLPLSMLSEEQRLQCLLAQLHHSILGQ